MLLKNIRVDLKTKKILIKEFDTHYEVNHNKDASPIILSKNI